MSQVLKHLLLVGALAGAAQLAAMEEDDQGPNENRTLTQLFTPENVKSAGLLSRQIDSDLWDVRMVENFTSAISTFAFIGGMATLAARSAQRNDVVVPAVLLALSSACAPYVVAPGAYLGNWYARYRHTVGSKDLRQLSKTMNAMHKVGLAAADPAQATADDVSKNYNVLVTHKGTLDQDALKHMTTCQKYIKASETALAKQHKDDYKVLDTGDMPKLVNDRIQEIQNQYAPVLQLGIARKANQELARQSSLLSATALNVGMLSSFVISVGGLYVLRDMRANKI